MVNYPSPNTNRFRLFSRRRDAVAGPRKLLDHVAAESRRPQQQWRVPAGAKTCARSRVNVGL